MKNIITLACFMFLWQLNFAQNYGTTTPINGLEHNSPCFFYVGMYGGNTVHIVWENAGDPNLKQIILEKSTDGINYTLLAKTDVSSLIDIYF